MLSQQSPSLDKGWRMRNSFMMFSALLVVLLLSPSTVTVVTATITLASTGTQYHSRPAAFGFNLEYGLQYGKNKMEYLFYESCIYICVALYDNIMVLTFPTFFTCIYTRHVCWFFTHPPSYSGIIASS